MKLLVCALAFLFAGYPSEEASSCGYMRNQVRLEGGRSGREGRVEVCNINWGSVCDDQWDDRDARVVCRQLGFFPNSTVAVAVGGSHFGGGAGSIWLQGVSCSGSEEKLIDCLTPAQQTSQWTPLNCGSHLRDAGVLCIETNGQNYVRLVGGRSEREGRVEVYHSGSWGTVCDDQWDNNDAKVVCRQLGYSLNTVAVSTRSSYFGSGSGPIWLGSVNCSGAESSLLMCLSTSGQQMRWGNHNCGSGHSRDAGVVCIETNSIGESIRLVGGRSGREGRVEVLHNAVWGTVCDDYWDNRDAQVVCQQLGFSTTTTESVSVRGSFFGRGSGQIWMDNVHCSGSESLLQMCHSTNNRAVVWGAHNCGSSHNKDAGVLCLETDSSGASVRLVGGRSEREGRVEVYHNGQWGTVCDDEWDNFDARVICRQLRFTSNTMATAVRGAHFGSGSGSTWLTALRCTGSESRLQQCYSGAGVVAPWGPHSCGRYRTTGVLCTETDRRGDYVRLVGGRSEREGRVEVYHNGRWGSVCDDQWDDNEAKVVCRQLGVSEDRSALSVDGELFGAVASTAVFSGVQCNGSESHLLLCHSGTWINRYCPSGTAGVACEQSGGCTEGEYRLTGRETEREGRVEVCHGGLWGTVCEGSWSHAQADTVCRALNFQGAQERGALATTATLFGNAVGIIWQFRVTQCGGNLQRRCSVFDWRAQSCSHRDDVGVICPGPKLVRSMCINVAAGVLYAHETLSSFTSAVASDIASNVTEQCPDPCSYSQQDIKINSSWPLVTLRNTSCLASTDTITFWMSCNYTARLNTTVHSVMVAVLGALGRTMSCTSEYRGRPIKKSVRIEQCVVSETSSIIIPPLFSSVEAQTSTKSEAMNTIIPSQSPILSSTAADTALRTSADRATLQMHSISSSLIKPKTTSSIDIIGNANNKSRSMNPTMVILIVFAGVISILLLLLLVLAGAFLVQRKKTKKQECLTSTSVHSGSTVSSCEQKQNGEMDMRAFASPENGNNIYELLDGGADYAILEQTPSSVQNISTTINRHEYALLEGNTATVRSDQCELWNGEVEATVPAVGFYSSLNQQPDYAILESEPRGAGSTEVSGALLANGNTEEPHKYQRIVLDSTYDRTFTNNID